MKPPRLDTSRKTATAAATALAAASLLYLVLALHWPLWVWLFLVLVCVAVVLACLVVGKFRLRRRERCFVEEMMEERTAASPADRRSGVELLQAQWQRAVTALRSSQLKKHGNPFYVLPWYLMIGEPGSGKTSCLDAAAISSPIEMSGAAGGEPTGSCDWRFFPDAIVLDTAGRYALQTEVDADREEWRTLLRLVARYRRREPIDGVIVTVAADRLGPETAGSYGTVVRRRIDEMMRVLGVRFPVYLLVTKCDLVPGLAEFAELLPDKGRNQPIGILNHDLGADPLTFLRMSLATVRERLRQQLLRLLVQREASSAQLIAFPQHIAKLGTGLEAFGEAAFGTNTYQETPLLRGLFFCSAAGSRTEAAPEPGVFLHDLFATLLPQERGIFTPTRRLLEWRSSTAKLALTAWIVLGIAASGLLTFSFLKNLSAIRQIPQELNGTAGPQGAPGGLAALARYRDAVAGVEAINSRWWLPRFGLNESRRVEQELKNRFCGRFREGFLAPADAGLERAIETNTAAATDASYGDHIVYLARRVNLLKAAQRGVGYQALKAMPQPSYPAGDAAANFGSLFLSYLSWQAESIGATREIRQLQDALARLIAQRNGSLQWLAAWLSERGSAPAVTVGEFWGGSRNVANEVAVSPAFTVRGGKEINALLVEIESALPVRYRNTVQRQEWEKWRSARSVALWKAFAAAFPTGMARLNGEREWQQAAAKMATEQNPYFVVLDRMAAELGPQPAVSETPDWIRQLAAFQRGSHQDAVQIETVKKAASGGRKLLVSLEKKMGKESSAQQLENALAASRAYADYRAALAGIVPMTASRTQAYQAACQLYTEDPAVCKSPLNTAFGAARQLNATLDAGGSRDATVSRLVEGPAEFLWSFVRRESSGYLQSQWEEQVLASTLGMTGPQATPLLVGPDGLVWKFVKGPAAPFLTRSLGGYRPKQVLGGTVQFEGSFLSFLDGGAKIQAATLTKQSNYAVGIQGLPTDANHEAKIKPHATRLELQCGTSSQGLANMNYPVGKTFNWSPDSCGDVTLQIEVGDLLLVKRYPGAQGFPEFLKSFSGGSKTFTSRDFPGEQAALKKMGIRQIRVNYQITGGAAVIKQTNAVCGQLPRNITRCTF